MTINDARSAAGLSPIPFPRRKIKTLTFFMPLERIELFIRDKPVIKLTRQQKQNILKEMEEKELLKENEIPNFLSFK